MPNGNLGELLRGNASYVHLVLFSILKYHYLKFTSRKFSLFGVAGGRDTYDWKTCYGIITGICQGLNYLHNGFEEPIYHLDLKPANVLLDEKMVPRIADFGISRLLRGERTQVTQTFQGTL
jgi:serine/threonine protein kinase